MLNGPVEWFRLQMASVSGARLLDSKAPQEAPRPVPAGRRRRDEERRSRPPISEFWRSG